MPRLAWSSVSYSFSHTSRSLSFPEPALDERLRLGVAVAAAAVADAELGELRAEAAGGEGRAVVAPEHEPALLDPVHRCCSFDNGDRLVGAAAQLEAPADDLAGAAVDDRVQVAPAVLGHPDARHVQLPELAWPLDPEEAGPLAPLQGAPPLDQLPLLHHPQDAFAVHRHAEPSTDEGADHPVAVSLVGERLGDDRLLDRVGRRSPLRHRPRRWCPVERLAADPGDTRHHRRRMPFGDEITRVGDALSHSHSRKSFPAISNSYVFLPSARSSSATLRRSSRSPCCSSLPASASRPPSSSFSRQP